MAKVIEGLYYSESHEFVRVEGDFGFIGITDYAQNALGNVVYVDVPEVDDEVSAGEEFGAVESVKAASDLTSQNASMPTPMRTGSSRSRWLTNRNSITSWMRKHTLLSARNNS